MASSAAAAAAATASDPPTVRSAPSKNLNVNYPQFDTASEMYDYLREATQEGGAGEFVLRNFVGVIRDISVEASTVETELFPKGALDYYTKKNMGWDYTKEEYGQWQLPERGGEQGDYREGVSAIKMVMMMLRGGQPIVFHIPVASPRDIHNTFMRFHHCYSSSPLSILPTLHPSSTDASQDCQCD